MTMLTDAVLVDRVVAGFEGDFDELYKRHASTAWRVAQAVTGNTHDSADAVAEAFARVFQAVKAGRLSDASAFRGYLMTATRNASLDTLRRGGRTKATDIDDLDRLELDAAGPSDMVEGTADSAMIADAFRNLPERWRSILWLTEVEGMATKDVAEQLGISPNGAAQLAVRARAGLRERFLQAHLKRTNDPDCRFTVDRLGAYVGGGLSPRDLAKVDQHLAGCEACLAKKAELEDMGSSLRRIVLPIPLALGAIAGTRVTAALISASHPMVRGASAGTRLATMARNPTPRVQRLVAASAATVFGLGVLALGFTGTSRPGLADLSSPAGATEGIHYALDLPSPSDISYDRGPAYHASVLRSLHEPVPPATSSLDLARSLPDTVAVGATPSQGGAATSGGSGTVATPPGAASPSVPLPALPLPEEPVVAVNIGGTFGGNSIGATVAVSAQPEVGVQVGDLLIGTQPTVPASDGLTATVDPIGVDPVTVSLP